MANVLANHIPADPARHYRWRAASFTISLDDFIITYFTTGPGTSLLPIEVYGKVKRGVTPEINAISSVMLLFSMLLVGLSQFVQRQRK